MIKLKYGGICIFGQMGAGKTTLANTLMEGINFSRGVTQIAAFGDRLKQDAGRYMLPSKEWNKRVIYQGYGQAMRELFGPDVWVNALDEYLDIHRGEARNYGVTVIPIIHDGRQPNEYEWATAKDYLTVGVVADREKRVQRLLDRDGYDQSEYFGHETEINALEMALKSAYLCNNNFGREFIKDTAVDILKMIGVV